MAELLIKRGENFPHKDLMLERSLSDTDAKQLWIEREVAKDKTGTTEKLTKAPERWADKCRGATRQGDVISVRPDGWEHGNRESYPRLFIAKIPDKELEALGFKWSGDEQNRRMRGFHQPLWEISPEVDPENAKYYHKWKYRLSEEAYNKLRSDVVVQLKASDIVEKTQYEGYEPTKALVHNSAGTFTIKSSGGDYTDLSTWESTEQMDLTSGGGQGLCIAECYNDWVGGLDDNVTIDGWTTDADNYVKITVPEGERHDGTKHSGFYLKLSSGNNTVSIKVSDSYTVIDGIEIDGAQSSGYSGRGIVVGTVTDVVIKNNFVYDIEFNRIVYFNFLSNNLLIYNNFFAHFNDIDNGYPLIHENSTFSDMPTGVLIANNTLYQTNDSREGILSRAASNTGISLKNNIVITTTGNAFTVPSPAADSDYNLSSDSTAPGANSITNASVYDAATAPGSDETCVVFNETASGSEDLHLSDNQYCDAIGGGVGPGSDANVPTTDIDGDSRSGSTCDIGADEYTAASSSSSSASTSSSSSSESVSSSTSPSSSSLSSSHSPSSSSSSFSSSSSSSSFSSSSSSSSFSSSSSSSSFSSSSSSSSFSSSSSSSSSSFSSSSSSSSFSSSSSSSSFSSSSSSSSFSSSSSSFSSSNSSSSSSSSFSLSSSSSSSSFSSSSSSSSFSSSSSSSSFSSSSSSSSFSSSSSSSSFSSSSSSSSYSSSNSSSSFSSSSSSSSFSSSSSSSSFSSSSSSSSESSSSSSSSTSFSSSSSSFSTSSSSSSFSPSSSSSSSSKSTSSSSSSESVSSSSSSDSSSSSSSSFSSSSSSSSTSTSSSSSSSSFSSSSSSSSFSSSSSSSSISTSSSSSSTSESSSSSSFSLSSSSSSESSSSSSSVSVSSSSSSFSSSSSTSTSSSNSSSSSSYSSSSSTLVADREKKKSISFITLTINKESTTTIKLLNRSFITISINKASKTGSTL